MDKISATLSVKFGSKQLFSGTLPDLPGDSLDSPVKFMGPALAGTTPGSKTIAINPGGTGDPVVFLLIASDTYGSDISYQLSTPATPTPAPRLGPRAHRPRPPRRPYRPPRRRPGSDSNIPISSSARAP